MQKLTQVFKPSHLLNTKMEFVGNLTLFLFIITVCYAAKRSVVGLHHRQIPSSLTHDMHSPDEQDSNFNVDFGQRRGHGLTNQRGTSEFYCPEMCTLELRLVCGSDGRTYDNKCLLNYAACKQRKRIFVEKEGRC